MILMPVGLMSGLIKIAINSVFDLRTLITE
jgi:hypothetical protein